MADRTAKLNTTNAREAAFLALFSAHQNQHFAHYYLNLWHQTIQVHKNDFALAQEIAYGSIRRQLSLDYIAKQACSLKKLQLKAKEKILLRLALYQLIFMDRVPDFAVVNEMVAISKQYCHPSFSKFLNALLRRVIQNPHSLPQGNKPAQLSLQHSFPPYFIQELIQEYGLVQTKSILEASNLPATAMVRCRKKNQPNSDDINPVMTTPFCVGTLKDKTQLPLYINSSDHYIQNSTPVMLIDHLSQGKAPFTSILDLCASPGGKTVLLHDLYPQAHLYANDISQQKGDKLNDNLTQYNVTAHTTCHNAADYPTENGFDLVILDLPCSNSGVLNKRHEARWRISETCLDELNQLQLKLLSHASSLLKEGGELWYMTCSILKKENEALLQKALKQLPLTLSASPLTLLPNASGQDGGFAVALTKK